MAQIPPQLLVTGLNDSVAPVWDLAATSEGYAVVGCDRDQYSSDNDQRMPLQLTGHPDRNTIKNCAAFAAGKLGPVAFAPV